MRKKKAEPKEPFKVPTFLTPTTDEGWSKIFEEPKEPVAPAEIFYGSLHYPNDEWEIPQ